MGAIAATRFGLGARPGEIAEAATDAQGWLLAQLDASRAPAHPPTPSAAERLIASHAADQVDRGTGAGPAFRSALANAELLTRARLGAETDAPFRERWTLFWLNHFALEADERTEMLSGAFAREAIEPHLLGRFDDMAVAALQHPAMLIALDQAESTGPNSPLGLASRNGLNENLAREALELHTLGAGSGYRQADVTELARALAGWTIGDPGGAADTRGRFVNDPARREPGARRLLGRSYAGYGAAEAMLRDAARRPETRARIALKVARHFVADDPPPALVGRLRRALETTDGSLDALARTLIAAPEAWTARQAKLKTPYEFLVSAHRALGLAPDDPGGLKEMAVATGHSPLWAATAAGASDRAEAWATPLGLTRRVQLARGLAGRAGTPEPGKLAGQTLGPLLNARTETAALSVSPEDGVALILLSPEFQYR